MRALLFLVILFQCFSLSADMNDRVLEEANRLFNQRDFTNAAQYYALYLDADDKTAEVHYKYAYACFQTYQYDLALKHFNETIELDVTSQYMEAEFWLGELYRIQQNYTIAKRHYRYYLAQNPTDTLLSRKADLLTRFNPSTIPNLENIEVYNQLHINTPQLDIAPFNYYNQLAYTSFEEGRETTKPQSRIFWVDTNAIQTLKIDTYFSSNTSLVGNQVKDDILYFSACKTNNRASKTCQIYTYNLLNPTTPKRCPYPINQTGKSAQHPYWVGDTLYYSANFDGSKGGNDIWSIVQLDSIRFSAPNNNFVLNSIGDEITPYYEVERQRLYCSSDFWPGLGGYDIFYQAENKRYNIGRPLNSSYNDIYFKANVIDSFGYLASNRIGDSLLNNTACCFDIYKFNWPQVPVVHYDTFSTDTFVPLAAQQLLPIEIYFPNDVPKKGIRADTTNLSYNSIYANYQNLKSFYKNEYLKAFDDRRERKQARKRANDFFDRRLSTMQDSLNLFLNLLRLETSITDTIHLKLKGYASPLATDAYNFALTQRRIASVKNYLMDYEGGIFASFITNGQFSIEMVAMGEANADQTISDQINDKAFAVYSPEAALERRVEIIAIRVEHGGE